MTLKTTSKPPQKPPKTPKTPPLTAKSCSRRAKSAPKPEKTGSIDPIGSRAAADRKNSFSRAQYKALSPAERAERRWRAEAKPPAPRPGTYRSQNPRTVALANAYCDWSDIEAVVLVYRVCAALNELGLGEFVIDHQIPLISPLVCGLHTHTNLRITERRENRIKSNLVWPDMWPIDWSTLGLLLGEA